MVFANIREFPRVPFAEHLFRHCGRSPAHGLDPTQRNPVDGRAAPERLRGRHLKVQ